MYNFNEIEQYLYPVTVTQNNGVEVTYFWEIKVSEVEGVIYSYAEEKSSGNKIPWGKSNDKNKEAAVIDISGRCYEKSK
ncbi:hypothetical protein AB0764_26885 (plasmid) [Priestia megaterium]|uniref:hypothetical protein n=1 Tax=Priestia megaterium TaxID=1404 RepID=UPI00351E34BB